MGPFFHGVFLIVSDTVENIEETRSLVRFSQFYWHGVHGVPGSIALDHRMAINVSLAIF